MDERMRERRTSGPPGQAEGVPGRRRRREGIGETAGAGRRNCIHYPMLACPCQLPAGPRFRRPSRRGTGRGRFANLWVALARGTGKDGRETGGGTPVAAAARAVLPRNRGRSRPCRAEVLLPMANLSLWSVRSAPAPILRPPPPVAPRTSSRRWRRPWRDAIAKAEPSVVAIAREKVGERRDDGGPGPQPGAAPGDPRLAVRPFSLDGRRGRLVRLRLGRRHRRHGRDPDRLPRRQGGAAAGRPRRRPPGVRGRDPRRRPAQRPRRDRAPRGPRGRRPPKLRPLALGDATRAPQGVVPRRAGQPVQRRRDGRASASWGILSNVARRLEPLRRGSRMQRLQLRNYPDAAPARRQAQPRHERRRGHQPARASSSA